MRKWIVLAATLAAALALVWLASCSSGTPSDTGDTYSASGAVTTEGAPLAGVTVAFTRAATSGRATSGSAVTTSGGTYTVPNLSPGVYTVIPTLSGYTFTPPQRSVTIGSSNVTGVDFTAAPTAADTYTIAGSVTAGGAALGGVTVTITNGSTIADTQSTGTDGTFTSAPLVEGTYVVTPTRTGYTFGPASRTVTLQGANATGQSFTGTQETVTPVLSLSPLSLDFGADQTAMSFNVVNAGEGTLTWSCATDQSWITASPTSGTGAGTIQVGVTRTSLAAGTHTGGVVVSSNGGSLTVSVSVTKRAEKIVFVSGRNGNDDIWVMNSDGSGLTAVAADATAVEHSPAWNDGATVIAYVSDEDNFLDNIFTMNADGTNKVNRTNFTGDSAGPPDWSPTGSSLTFVRQDAVSASTDVILWPLSGASSNLTNSPEDEYDPAYSPTGAYIAYSRVDGADATHLYVIEPTAGAQPSRVTPTSHIGNVRHPQWSPDGEWIVFDSEAGNTDDNRDIWMIRRNGDGLVKLTTHTGQDEHPCFSADGAKIVFHSNRGGFYKLYTMNLDGTGVTQISSTHASNDKDPDWSR